MDIVGGLCSSISADGFFVCVFVDNRGRPAVGLYVALKKAANLSDSLLYCDDTDRSTK